VQPTASFADGIRMIIDQRKKCKENLVFFFQKLYCICCMESNLFFLSFHRISKQRIHQWIEDLKTAETGAFALLGHNVT